MSDSNDSQLFSPETEKTVNSLFKRNSERSLNQGVTRRQFTQWLGSGFGAAALLPAFSSLKGQETQAITEIVELDSIRAALPIDPNSGWSKSQPKDTLTDPNMVTPKKYWEMTMTESEKAITKTLADLIIPADEHSPAASEAKIVEFFDEWISAPYPTQKSHAEVIRKGFAWLENHAHAHFQSGFVQLKEADQIQILELIHHEPDAKPEYVEAAKFFNLFRDLTVSGYYSSSIGWQDLGFRGNVPLQEFEGAPQAVLEKLGLKRA